MKIKNVIGNVGKPELCDKKLTAAEVKMTKSYIKIVPISKDHETAYLLIHSFFHSSSFTSRQPIRSAINAVHPV